ncbi:MAG: hypothetical protein LBM77_03750 [Spirochaetaceae bacterium]|jgi:hypothetical protein|nr:hypothetical protein [Spirochaetaceae bacterium]
MKKIFTILHFFTFYVCCTIVFGQESTYYTGSAGSGSSIAVIPIVSTISQASKGTELSSLIQSSLSSDFQRFSGMTVLNRANFDSIVAEQKKAEGEEYSQDDAIEIGKMIKASYIVTGTLQEIRGGYVLSLAITDVGRGTRKASFGPANTNEKSIRNLSVLKDASESFLKDLGIQLTDAGKTVLHDVSAIDANARASNARADAEFAADPTSVNSLMYSYAAGLSPALMDAAQRATVIARDISTGRLTDAIRNDIQWRTDWVNKLSETEKSVNDFFNDPKEAYNQPYALVYSTVVHYDINSINYTQNTAPISFQYTMRQSADWTTAVTKTVTDIKRGLTSAVREAEGDGRTKWDLSNWPQESVSKLKPFVNGSKTLVVQAELVNSNGKVIGRKSISLVGSWTCNPTAAGLTMTTSFNPSTMQNLTFDTVNIDEITDNITLRFTRVNNMSVSEAGQQGILNIITTDLYRDAEGYDYEGYNNDGFNRDGYGRDGYGRDGFNKDDRDRDGYDRNGYDSNGFDRNGKNRDGKTREQLAEEEERERKRLRIQIAIQKFFNDYGPVLYGLGYLGVLLLFLLVLNSA